MYSEIYICDHPVYSRCTLYQIDKKGLAVIQQRYDPKTKHTWWTEIDPWITDDLYLHPKFKEFFRCSFWSVSKRFIPYSYNTANYVVFENETYKKGKMGDLFL